MKNDIRKLIYDIIYTCFVVVSILGSVAGVCYIIYRLAVPIQRNFCRVAAEELHLDYEFSRGSFLSPYHCIYILPDGRRSFKDNYRVLDTGSYIDLD